MPMQMKRPAVAKAASEARTKKQQHEDPRVTKCDVIIGALSSAEGIPEATRRMLTVGAKASLTVPKESRHTLQNSVIEMIGEVLKSVEVGHVAKVDALRCKIAAADAEKLNREATAEAAITTLEENSAAVVAVEKALEEANATTNAAKEAQKVAVSEQGAGDADLLKADERKAMAENVVIEDLRPLKDGTSADIGKSVDNLAKVAKELGLDVQLIRSVELVLRMAPAERGSFGSMVTDQVDEQLGKAIAKLADQSANGEAGKAERASKVEDCSKRVDVAIAHRDACQEQLGAAKAALKEAEAARIAAEKYVKDFGPEMEDIAMDAEAADILLGACKADMATFTELVEAPQAAPEATLVEVANVEVAQHADMDAVQVASPDTIAA